MKIKKLFYQYCWLFIIWGLSIIVLAGVSLSFKFLMNAAGLTS